MASTDPASGCRGRTKPRAPALTPATRTPQPPAKEASRHRRRRRRHERDERRKDHGEAQRADGVTKHRELLPETRRRIGRPPERTTFGSRGFYTRSAAALAAEPAVTGRRLPTRITMRSGRHGIGLKGGARRAKRARPTTSRRGNASRAVGRRAVCGSRRSAPRGRAPRGDGPARRSDRSLDLDDRRQ